MTITVRTSRARATILFIGACFLAPSVLAQTSGGSSGAAPPGAAGPATGLPGLSGASTPGSPVPSTPLPTSLPDVTGGPEIPVTLEPIDADFGASQPLEQAKEALQKMVEDRRARDAQLRATGTPIAPDDASARTRAQGPSAFERYVWGRMPSDVDLEIKQFGYELFENRIVTFTPVTSVPVGPDYIVGPDDQLVITVWGATDARYDVTVDREGKVTLPELGVVYVGGLTFEETKALINKRFNRFYKNTVQLTVGMGALRTMKIFVVGHVVQPGSFEVSSLSTLVNALFAAGGPTKNGSMRNIQVKRDGKTVVAFDFYDFLLRGDKSKDIRLLPSDVIFVPPVGPLAGVAGNVNTPAVFELSGETHLQDLLDMAGGVRATGYTQRLQVERIFKNTAKGVLDLNLEALNERSNVLMQDGDLVKIFSISQAITNPIELSGNCQRPGTYEWREGIRVKDILTGPEMLLPDTFFDFALIERLVPPYYQKAYVSIDLKKLLFEGDEDANLELQPYDKIVVFDKKSMKDDEKVRIAGAVNRPGSYEFRDGMTLSDLLKLAGGLKRYAYRETGELTRIRLTQDGPVTERLIVNPGRALRGDAEFDFPLREDDFLHVRQIPDYHVYRVVNLVGQVKFPGAYTIRKGEPISSVIERAGGYTTAAYLKGAMLRRASVARIQKQHLDQIIDRLEFQLMRPEGAKPLLDQAETDPDAEKRKEELIAKLRAQQPLGRLTIRLWGPLESFRASDDDIPMEGGDTLVIPERSNQVQVLGSVFNESAFVHRANGTVSTYLRLAGGATEDADESEMFLLKVDGTVASARQPDVSGVHWDPEGRRWVAGGFLSMRPDPGDTLVVPEELDHVAWLQDIRDVSQILLNLAVTTGVFIGIANGSIVGSRNVQ
ncbi:MAG: SLBB domain-containing protein [Deltaproteobacteria bacterium]|nr:SLBB domain-containing protein [Deltaproteobacteria bacterium]